MAGGQQERWSLRAAIPGTRLILSNASELRPVRPVEAARQWLLSEASVETGRRGQLEQSFG